MAKKTFHQKNDGSTVVKEHGKIVTNLPSDAARGAALSAAPEIPALAGGAAIADNPAAAVELMYAQFVSQSSATESPTAVLDHLIDVTDQSLAGLRLQYLGVDQKDEVVPIDSIGPFSFDHPYEPGTLVSPRIAEDLYRLEKAVLREQRTILAQEQDAVNGIQRLHTFGDGPLGSAHAEGFHEPNSRAWLLARTQGIGGSDKIGYYNEAGEFVPYDSDGKRNYLNSILEKKSPAAIAEIETLPEQKPDERDQALALRIGNHLERTIQYEFAVNHPEYTHLEDKYTRTALGRKHHRFNPDGVLRDNETGEYGIFEAKTSRNSETFDKALPGYMAQCLHNAAAADLDFAVLVADVDGEPTQRVVKMTFTPEQRQSYRDALDRVWLLYKPQYDKTTGAVRALSEDAA